MFANPVKALVDLAGEKAAQGCSVDAPDQEFDILVTLKKNSPGTNGVCNLSLGDYKVILTGVTGDTLDIE